MLKGSCSTYYYRSRKIKRVCFESNITFVWNSRSILLVLKRRQNVHVVRRGSVDFSAIFFVKAIQFNPDGWTDRLFKDILSWHRMLCITQKKSSRRLPRLFTVFFPLGKSFHRRPSRCSPYDVFIYCYWMIFFWTKCITFNGRCQFTNHSDAKRLVCLNIVASYVTLAHNLDV